MDIRSKRNSALSVVTAATLAASLGVPAVAVADEAAHSSQNVAVDGQNEAQASGVNDVKAAAIVQVNGVEYDSFEGALAAIAATDVANVKLLDSIEVSDRNIGDFLNTARKYDVDFALKRDKSTSPPT